MSLRLTILSSFSLSTTKLKRDKNKCRKKTCNKVKTNQRGTTRTDGHSVPLVWSAERLRSWEVLIPPPPPPPLLVGYLSITGLLPVVWQIYEFHSDSNVNGTEVNTGFVQIFGSKIQVFFQTQGRWSTEILRMQEQSFFHCTLQTYG